QVPVDVLVQVQRVPGQADPDTDRAQVRGGRRGRDDGAGDAVDTGQFRRLHDLLHIGHLRQGDLLTGRCGHLEVLELGDALRGIGREDDHVTAEVVDGGIADVLPVEGVGDHLSDHRLVHAVLDGFFTVDVDLQGGLPLADVAGDVLGPVDVLQFFLDHARGLGQGVLIVRGDLDLQVGAAH